MTLQTASTAQEAAALDAMLAALPPVDLDDVPALRRRRELLGRFYDDGPADVVSVDSVRGGVPVRAYTNETTDDRVIVVYVHGGGWVTGGLETHDGTCRRLCRAARARVVSVDYRRAPECPWPGPARDVLAVVDTLVGDAATLTLAGDSSGATIVLDAITLADGRVDVAALLLVQPACDPGMSSAAWQADGAGRFLSRAAMAAYWRAYLGAATDFVAPADRDLRRLPPTRVLTSTRDPLRDEGSRLVRRLRRAGCEVTHRSVADGPHGCFTLPRAFPSVQPEMDAAGRWLAAHTTRQPRGSSTR